MLQNLIHNVGIFLVGFLSWICAFPLAIAGENHVFEAEAAKRIGGASKLADRGASGGSLVGLNKSGQGVTFARQPAASKLAIRYASVEVGTLNIAVNDQGLTVTPHGAVQPLALITNQSLASACRVLRIAHDKSWFNDDDSGAMARGWVRRCNLGTGDFNNDLTTTDTPGDVWRCSFTGTSVSIIAPQEPGAGNIEVQIDGQPRATAYLSTTGTRQTQQRVCEINGLIPGQHAINIVNRGPGPVAVNALVVR
jgi:hypothetical protein